MKTINEVRKAVFTETHRLFKARVRRNMISNDSSEFAKLLRQMWKTYMDKYKADKWIEETKEAKKRPAINQISEKEMNAKRYYEEKEWASRGFSID